MPSDILDKNVLRARVFKALGHPVRMALVELLMQGERCVCELTEACDGNMPAVSKHLAVLREAGVVTSRREGTNIHYRLRMPCVRQFIICVDTHLGEEVRGLAELLGAAPACACHAADAATAKNGGDEA
ncbi:putative transcriptional regulator, ArsR family [Desulfovibrio sp. X2]|uniref:ArsR/SmtB family transcription factor n=1 Tax=Desulfovibrio sp. X2 TaxID=941449 RepID=UPI000358B32C|nr:metalloregulator ArsR/SmtB family transcription factor [Desulfovibrio sp. X2]EPR37662.1 putative transcriptional regulator, ArsR family [Desulfovibrio sp. X2]